MVAGLVGPLLAGLRRFAPPAVVGEIAAGVIVGPHVLHWVHADDPGLALFSSVGFALLMFVVGTHLPVRDLASRSNVWSGLRLAGTTAALAIGAGFALAPITQFRHPLVLAVVLASSSAAVALPVLHERNTTGPSVVALTAWIAAADVAAVLAIPLVLPAASIVRSVLGGLIVITVTALVYVVARATNHTRVVGSLRRQSRDRGWALDLRASLALLFALAWIANRFGTSVLIAGFAVGVLITLLGEPRRVALQLIGVAEGFFVPLFFVDLGARLDLRGFLADRHAVLLACGVVLGSMVVHIAAARIWRLPVGSGLAASAQLGVPSAIASIGLQLGTLTPAQASALMAAAVGSLAMCAIGAGMLGRSTPIGDHAAPIT
jgi:Kef-type K+ transport system membrane component KefB